MNRLRQEWGVAPRAGVAISALIGLVVALVWSAVVGHRLPPAANLGAAAVFGLFFFVYGYLVSYVFGDARRRGMRAGVWALVAALVPNALGLIAYFLLREPLLQRCGACGATVRRELAFCPQCGSPLRRACPSCRQPLEEAWSHCAHCGTKIADGPAGA